MSTASIPKIAIAARHFGSGRSRVTAVDGVSLEVRHGELVMIAGPSGSGKTTLVSMLGCLLTRAPARSGSRARRYPSPTAPV